MMTVLTFYCFEKNATAPAAVFDEPCLQFASYCCWGPASKKWLVTFKFGIEIGVCGVVLALCLVVHA
jgi:hypothetical protein